MPKECCDYAVKIEAGQILNPDSFPKPDELVCIQVPKIFDQTALRDCITRNIVLLPGLGVCRPVFSFEGINNVSITEVKVISKSDSLTKPGSKKLKLSVKIKYDILYSDGTNQLTQPDKAVFNLTVNEVYCPHCLAQTGVAHYQSDNLEATGGSSDTDELFINVEALIETYGETICPCTGALILDIGAFFVIKCESIVRLLIPSYGYCSVPIEQSNPSTLNCATFNDKIKTTFPTRFFPD